MYTSLQIRQMWATFWQSKDHQHLQEASLIADSQNKTVLFNVAGMQQLVPYLSGKDHPLGRRLYNIQKCIRTKDIEDIGDERHLTMFEMMGNRSLGDYFKQDSLTRSVEFLVQVLGIDMNRLGATVFAGDLDRKIPMDQESIDILKSLGIQHIKQMGFDESGESDNFWTPGPVGPCGPCCEFYYDRGPAYGPEDRNMGVNDRYTEIRNNVFMAYHADGSGALIPLPQQNVDTGMGFERLTMVLQGTDTIFETDVFADLIQSIQKHTDSQYTQHLKSYRVILDHSRAAINLLDEGVTPSNEARGYILRRLIRRMVYHIYVITHKVNISHLIQDLIRLILPDTTQNQTILHNLIKEISQFEQTIKHGQKLLQEVLVGLPEGAKISGSTIFKLYDTHGFPVELTQEICDKHGVVCDLEAYDLELQKAQNLSRQHQNFKKDIDRASYIKDVAPTEFMYECDHISNIHLLKDFIVGSQRVIILDKTVCYAEGGGQVGDRGTLILDSGESVDIVDVKKFEGVFLHFLASSGA